MTSSEIQRAARRPFISVGEFAIFQIAATWGVAFAAYYLTASAAEIGSLIDRNISMRLVHWILTENPYFPVQILLGLYSGWMLARIFKKRIMLWVWILPLFILTCAVISFPNMTLGGRSIFETLARSSLGHYFGKECQAQKGCLDQLLITMPCYVSIAYAIGAGLGLRSRQD